MSPMMKALFPRVVRPVTGLAVLASFAPGVLTAQNASAPQAPASAVESGPKPEPTLPDLIDALPQESLQEAFRLLREDYIKRDTLSFLELNRSALQGLLERLEFGATLLTRESREARDSPFLFHSEKLSKTLGYVRFGRFRKEEVTELDKALVRFGDEPDLRTLILDLRSPQRQADFDIAASILSRFRPEGELLFKIRRPRDERPQLFLAKTARKQWDGPVIVLIDRETGNVGEIIAAVLKNRDGSLLVGEPTIGMTVEYRDVPIGEDRILRYGVAEVVLPDDSSLFRVGLTPDIRTPASTKVKQAIFRETREHPLSDFIFEKQRPRLNEAALVAGTDPELDYYVAKSNNRPTEWDRPRLRDRTLNQAVDLLTAEGFVAPVPGGEARKK